MASKLHDGSRWVGNTVVDDGGNAVLVSAFECATEERWIVAGREKDSDTVSTHYISDVLAVIRRANLDPLAIAARELCDLIPNLDEKSRVLLYDAYCKLEELLP